MKNIRDLFLKYEDIAQSYDQSVQVGGGWFYNKVLWEEDKIDDWHIPGLESLLRYLENTYKKIDDNTANNIVKGKSVSVINQDNISNHLVKKAYFITKKLSMINQDNISTTVSKKYNVNNNIKRVPMMINVENNFYYIKKNNNALVQQINNLTAEIQNIKSHLNI